MAGWEARFSNAQAIPTVGEASTFAKLLAKDKLKARQRVLERRGHTPTWANMFRVGTPAWVRKRN